jgi:hypothetical protein
MQTELALKEEDNGQFQSPSSTPDWFQPGLDIEITDATIADNDLTRTRQPDKTSSIGSTPGNYLGEISLTWTYTGSTWHSLLPLSSGALRGDHRLANTHQLYINADAFDSGLSSFSQVLAFAGCALTSAEVSYNEGELVSVDATIGLGEPIPDPAPSTIVQPSAGDAHPHHSTSITVDGTTQNGARSATLSMPNLAYRSGQADRKPRKWTAAGDMELEFSLSSEFTETDQLETALGGSDVTSLQDAISGFSSTTFEVGDGSGTTTTYTLTDLTPAEAALEQLADPSGDAQESLTYHVGDVSV